MHVNLHCCTLRILVSSSSCFHNNRSPVQFSRSSNNVNIIKREVKYIFLLDTAVSVVKREGNLGKHSSTTTVNTGATDDASEYQRFYIAIQCLQF